VAYKKWYLHQWKNWSFPVACKKTDRTSTVAARCVTVDMAVKLWLNPRKHFVCWSSFPHNLLPLFKRVFRGCSIDCKWGGCLISPYIVTISWSFVHSCSLNPLAALYLPWSTVSYIAGSHWKLCVEELYHWWPWWRSYRSQVPGSLGRVNLFN
jgi:hypothetical protein